MPLDHTASGVYVIATTPFLDDYSIDTRSIDRLTDFYAEAGSSGMTILGIMGEAPKLDHSESIAIVKQVMGRTQLPVVVGVSAPGFASMRSLARQSMELGAQGVMIAPPSNLRTDDQIRGYYASAIEAIGDDVPVVIQDYPLTLSVVMTPAVIRDIVNAHPSCVMLKHEDWPGLEKISALRGFQTAGEMRAISILCGNGAMFLDFEMERGADGAMTGYAFTDALVDIVRLQAEGRREEAHDLFDAHLPLMRYEQQQGLGLAVRKYLLMQRGLMTSDRQRKPAGTLTAKAKEEIDYLLAR
ncbi:dihydrodipicolinate synthase family protein, partial [Pelagibacterium lacus]